MRWRGQGPALSVQVLTRTNEDAVKWSWDHSHAHHFREDSSAANDYFLGQHLFLLEADPTPGGPVIHPCLALGSE